MSLVEQLMAEINLRSKNKEDSLVVLEDKEKTENIKKVEVVDFKDLFVEKPKQSKKG